MDQRFVFTKHFASVVEPHTTPGVLGFRNLTNYIACSRWRPALSDLDSQAHSIGMSHYLEGSRVRFGFLFSVESTWRDRKPNC